MVYVFDTSCFIILKSYFPTQFPSFWDKFDDFVEKGKIISVREVSRELETHSKRSFLEEWIKKNKAIFKIPNAEEMNFVKQIFQIQHFQYLIKRKSILSGTPTADPFVIASAKVHNGCVVTEEEFKENGAKIPNVCQHFGVDCTNLEGFLDREGWRF
jgi:hypothetical protein